MRILVLGGDGYLGWPTAMHFSRRGGDVLVTMTLTSLGCPLGPVIVQEVQGALKEFEGIGEIDVKLVWSPPWSPELMSEEAKDELGIW